MQRALTPPLAPNVLRPGGTYVKSPMTEHLLDRQPCHLDNLWPAHTPLARQFLAVLGTRIETVISKPKYFEVHSSEKLITCFSHTCLSLFLSPKFALRGYFSLFV